MIGDQRRDPLAAIAKVSEHTVDRGLEAGESRIVLIPERGLLEKPPQLLDQIEIGPDGGEDQMEITYVPKPLRGAWPALV
jgi:hypothetical protein